MGNSVERDKNVYQYDLTTIDGKKSSLQEFEGDVILIVNTASECGYTSQYKGLQDLYETYSDRGFKVVGFPANNFGGQEPGSEEEILQFCEVNYGVNFPLFSKTEVKGSEIHPLFEFLTKEENPDFTGDIKWNFEKFLIDKEGNLLRRFRSAVTPSDENLVEAIEQAMGIE